MKKDNWKLIKKLVSNYGDNKKEKEPQIIPVFAYRNVSPLDVNEKFIEIFNKQEIQVNRANRKVFFSILIPKPVNC